MFLRIDVDSIRPAVVADHREDSALGVLQDFQGFAFGELLFDSTHRSEHVDHSCFSSSTSSKRFIVFPPRSTVSKNISAFLCCIRHLSRLNATRVVAFSLERYPPQFDFAGPLW